MTEKGGRQSRRPLHYSSYVRDRPRSRNTQYIVHRTSSVVVSSRVVSENPLVAPVRRQSPVTTELPEAPRERTSRSSVIGDTTSRYEVRGILDLGFEAAKESHRKKVANVSRREGDLAKAKRSTEHAAARS